MRKQPARLLGVARGIRDALSDRLRQVCSSIATIATNWEVHETGNGWRECSGVVRAPSGGVLEWQALGLTGCEVRFVIDGELGEARNLGAAIARFALPVQAGRHRIGVQWRGRVDAPTNISARFHELFRTIRDMELRAPRVAAVMKKNNTADFIMCDALIVSQPYGMSCQVYGIFTVDKRALRSGRPRAPVVKQDFMVHDRNVEPPEITYYTGFRAPGPHRSIEEFCERFGEPNYGCRRGLSGWRCADHHYPMEEFDRLPKEPRFRRAIDAAIASAKRDV